MQRRRARVSERALSSGHESESERAPARPGGYQSALLCCVSSMSCRICLQCVDSTRRVSKLPSCTLSIQCSPLCFSVTLSLSLSPPCPCLRVFDGASLDKAQPVPFCVLQGPPCRSFPAGRLRFVHTFLASSASLAALTSPSSQLSIMVPSSPSTTTHSVCSDVTVLHSMPPPGCSQQ